MAHLYIDRESPTAKALYILDAALAAKFGIRYSEIPGAAQGSLFEEGV
jgi:hypothetical protein